MSTAVSCKSPTYWRTLGGQFVNVLVLTPFVVAGGAVGAAVGKKHAEAAGVDPTAGVSGGALAGAVLGAVLGFVPALFAQRAVLRGHSCKNPSLAKVFLADLVAGAVSGAARAGGNIVNPKFGSFVAVAAPFAVVPVAQEILKD